MISRTLASPLQRLMISAAIASALNTRSGASSTQPPCASLCTSRTPRGRRGRASILTASAMAGPLLPRQKSAQRDVRRRHIGVMERIQHRPQHAALEFECAQHGLLLLRCSGMALDIVKRKLRIAPRQRRTLAELGKGSGAAKGYPLDTPPL